MSFAADLLRAAGRRGVPLLEEQVEAMATHYRLLQRWNPAARLTSLTAEGEILDRHFLESLEAVRFLPEDDAAGEGARLVDVGSGGGFPAFPLLVARPRLTGVLLEPASRKRAFLKEVARELGMADRVSVLPERIHRPEDLHRQGPFDVLTARAVGVQEVLLEGATHSLRPGGRVLLFLGQDGARAVARALPSGLRQLSAHRLPARRTACIVVLARAQLTDNKTI